MVTTASSMTSPATDPRYQSRMNSDGRYPDDPRVLNWEERLTWTVDDATRAGIRYVRESLIAIRNLRGRPHCFHPPDAFLIGWVDLRRSRRGETPPDCRRAFYLTRWDRALCPGPDGPYAAEGGELLPVEAVCPLSITGPGVTGRWLPSCDLPPDLPNGLQFLPRPVLIGRQAVSLAANQ